MDWITIDARLSIAYCIYVVRTVISIGFLFILDVIAEQKYAAFIAEQNILLFAPFTKVFGCRRAKNQMVLKP